ncbi:MAG: FadR family transcriptional regulator [Ardenticatenaceae bacterium]|nr:FadR family transcriptional regulator [Ardenticatenaceae bacterium]
MVNNNPQMKALKRRKLLSEAVQDEIKSYIIQHALKPGDTLPPETELAHQLGVSRTSVREAVKSLEALGILKARSGTGVFVRDFTFDPILDNLPYGMLFGLKEVANILEVRFHLEYGMVERVVESTMPAQLKKLNLVLEQMREAAERGSYSADEDRMFHQILYENVDNLILSRIVDIFWVVFHQAQEHASIPGPVDPMDTYRRHVDIVDALQDRDVDAMRAAMVRHYQGIQARVQPQEDALDTRPG